MKVFKVFIVAIWLFIPLVSFSQNLQRIACKGDLSKLDSLLKQGVNINTKDKRGLTLLHFAVACNQKKIVEFLIEKGANVNVMDQRKYTPLYFAAAYDRTKLFDLLIAAKADVTKGPSPMFYAVLNDNLAMLKQLMTPKVKIDSVNSRGNTALAIAMRQGSDDMAKFLIAKGADKSKIPTFNLRGAYVGQTRPQLEPKMFAPNFISTENMTHSASFSPDGKTFYYTLESRKYHGGTIMVSRLKGKKWTVPQPSSIEGTYREIDPFVTSDGSKMFFSSNRPADKNDTLARNIDLWMVKREGKKWGKPIHLGKEVNTPHADWFPTLSKKGTLFFSTGPGRKSNICYSVMKNGIYQKAVPLSDSVNSPYYDYDPLIAPDESFVIFSSRRPKGFGSSDLYVSFKKTDGTWTKAKNMGKAINTKRGEYAPALSPDGQYFFFTRGLDIYWVSAEVIKKLK